MHSFYFIIFKSDLKICFHGIWLESVEVICEDCEGELKRHLSWSSTRPCLYKSLKSQLAVAVGCCFGRCLSPVGVRHSAQLASIPAQVAAMQVCELWRFIFSLMVLSSMGLAHQSLCVSPQAALTKSKNRLPWFLPWGAILITLIGSENKGQEGNEYFGTGWKQLSGCCCWLLMWIHLM
jgi:hypothetical protein